VLRELQESGVLPGAELVASCVVRLPGTHPECPVGTTERLAALTQYVATVPGLVTVGRHGRHGTPGIGDCMEMALDTVAELLEPAAASVPDEEVAGVA
jgi:protoporphyrinogen oxidase